jgi:branched-chain amino acid transport system permease protein
MVRLSFALSGLLGSLAGAIVAPLAMAQYNMGIMLGLKGFAAAILGGIGNPFGAVLGGLLLGTLESLGAGVSPAGWSGYKDAIAFGVMLLVLLAKPSGLLGRRSAA